MLALSLALVVTAAQVSSPEGFRAQVIVEEAGESTTYQVYFGKGTLRVDPPDAELFVLVDVTSPGLTLVYPESSCYYRVEPPEHRILFEMGVLDRSWFPWVVRVSADLLEDVSLEAGGSAPLPDGRTGRRFEGVSPTYHRVVAAYTVDPDVAPDLFFQWRDAYFELWADSQDESDDPQRKRLALYAELPGLPVVSEERFLYLSRPRTTRLEGRERLPEDAFTIPEDYQEGDPRELYWESLSERILREFGIKERDSDFCADPTH